MWRVGRGPDPLALREPFRAEDLTPGTGNRFDSPLGEYRVIYFSTSMEGCFGETLARFRPDLELIATFDEEGYMPLGEVPSDWRQRRLATRVRIGRVSTGAPAQFLDVEALATRQLLRTELAELLLGLGYNDLDVATIRGSDRRLTRWISDWTYRYVDEDGDFPFAGIRYRSRLDNRWECWAVFIDDDIVIEEQALRPIARNDPALVGVAGEYGLHVF